VLGVRATAPPTAPVSVGAYLRGFGFICCSPSGKPLRVETVASAPHSPLLGVSGRRARQPGGGSRGGACRIVRCGRRAPRSRERRLRGRSRLVLGGGHPTLLLHEPVSWLGSRGGYSPLLPSQLPPGPRALDRGAAPPPPGSGGGPGFREKGEKGKGRSQGSRLGLDLLTPHFNN